MKFVTAGDKILTRCEREILGGDIRTTRYLAEAMGRCAVRKFRGPSMDSISPKDLENIYAFLVEPRARGLMQYAQAAIRCQ